VPIEILADLTQVKPSSPEWLKLRKQGIGGSDAAAVCGIGRRTPYQVWADKVNPNVPEELEEPEYMRWGKLLEEPVRQEFEQRTGIEVHRFPRMVRNSDYPFMLANVDGLIGDPAVKLTAVYEGKTTRLANQWTMNDDGSVNVPLDYVVQGMHYLAVLELERVFYACLIGGQELRIAEVELNPNLVADLIEIEDGFWRKVIEQEPPEVTGADVATLRARWQPTPEKRVELPGTFATALKVRAQHKANIKSLEKLVDDIDAEIMAFMGDAEEATVNGKVVVTWKETAGRLKGKELEAAYPEIAAQFKGAPSRRFTPKEITE
jgi:putative phage-type endonuclease